MHTFGPSVDGFHLVGYQTTNDLRRRAEEHFRRQQQEKASFRTVKEFEEHRQRVRRHFLDAIGGLPGPLDAAQRPPVPVEITGTLDESTFTVEKLIYESLPGYPVTAACYIPKNLTVPAAAVVKVHGHADNGKSYNTYQAVCRDLVNNGFIVLAIDPVGQGERHEFVEGDIVLHGPCTSEHIHAGTPFWLRGASIARHFIWDIMRGIDYLTSRPDVDAQRIGITGNSGGGTQTSYVMMCEPRLAAAVPCTFPMMLENYMKTGQPQDAEQIIPGCMVHGPDHDDYITAIAPRPVLVGAAAYDFFPIEGTTEAVRRAKNIYALYGKEDNVDMAVAPTTHQYAPQLRQAAVNWFKKHLQGKDPDFVTGQPEVFEEQKLWATQSGHVYRDRPQSKTALQLNAEELPPPPQFESVEEHREALAKVLSLSAAGERAAPIYPRVISNTVVGGYRTEKIFFFSATDIVVTGVLVHPRGEDAQAALPVQVLLLENGTEDILRSQARIEKLLRQGKRVFVFDVRGVGALREFTAPQGGDYNIYHTNHEYKTGCDAMMLGISTLGLRVFDVLRAFDYLNSREDVSQIHLEGIGSGAYYAFFAAALEPEIASLTCEDMLASYRDLCNTRDYLLRIYHLKIMAYGLLQCGDIADYLPLLKGRKVEFIRSRNALGEVIED